jgi:hypothetical protein
MRKIAIIGLGEPNRKDAPWDDAEWELWGLPWDDEGYFKFQAAFDLHDYYLHTKPEAGLRKDYTERLCEFPGRLFMQKNYPEVPNSRAYPLQGVISAIGADYFNSGPSYAMGMAIAALPAEIGLWGLYMAKGTEWAVQRPNMEYLIGIARGKGITVTIPDDSPLCQFDGDGIPLGSMYPEYKERYGYL